MEDLRKQEESCQQRIFDATHEDSLDRNGNNKQFITSTKSSDWQPDKHTHSHTFIKNASTEFSRVWILLQGFESYIDQFINYIK